MAITMKVYGRRKASSTTGGALASFCGAESMRDAEMVVDDGTITSHVKRIRRKFQAIDPAFAAIETIYGMGYRWMAAP